MSEVYDLPDDETFYNALNVLWKNWTLRNRTGVAQFRVTLQVQILLIYALYFYFFCNMMTMSRLGHSLNKEFSVLQMCHSGLRILE